MCEKRGRWQSDISNAELSTHDGQTGASGYSSGLLKRRFPLKWIHGS